MKVLGIDTSGSVCSAGVVDQEGVLAERSVRGARVHSIQLLPIMESVLSDAGCQFADLDGIAITIGPGSFTGLRIGLAAAKTLGQIIEVPLVGINTLEALAFQLIGAQKVWAMLPARQNEVYAAQYICRNAFPEMSFPPASVEIPSLIEILKDNRGVFLVGEGAELYEDALRQALGKKITLAPFEFNHLRGGTVAGLGLRYLEQGAGENPLFLNPDYIRPPAAELVWQKRQRGG